MNIIIFSDIHGNQYAYREFMKHIEHLNYDYIIFCGDIFGYYYGQLEIIDSLCKMKNLIWIKGNHDENAVNIYSGYKEPKEYVIDYGHSYSSILAQCSKQQIELIRNLPNYRILNLNGKKIGVFHGTPEDHLNGRLYPKDMDKLTNIYDTFDYVILGHTHFRLEYKYKNTQIINPGSLGQHRDGKGFGYYLLNLDYGEGKFVNVKIDTDELYKEIEKYDKTLVKLKKVLERRCIE